MPQCEGTSKKTGERCTAPTAGDGKLCAGHAGLGLGGDPKTAAAQGGLAKAAVSRARAEHRKKTALDHAADALERNGRALADGIVAAAERGDWRAAAFLYERVYGKPAERLTLETPVDPLQVATMSAEERAALQARILEDHPELSALVPRRTPDVQQAKKTA